MRVKSEKRGPDGYAGRPDRALASLSQPASTRLHVSKVIPVRIYQAAKSHGHAKADHFGGVVAGKAKCHMGGEGFKLRPETT